MYSKEEEKVINLIELYKNNEILWNPSNPDHFKKTKKEDAWQEISDKFGESVEMCKRKITSLLAGYRRERSKIKKSQGTGKGTDEVYVSRWYAFEFLKFLQDRDKPRKRFNTEISRDTSESSERQEEGDVTPSQEPPKRKRFKKPEGHMALMSDAIDILKVAADRIASGTNDESKAFDVKTRWESLRSQYRKYLSKLKTKSGQSAAKIGKWRYHDQMSFLNKFLNSDMPSVQDMEIFNEEREGSNERDLNDSQNGDDNQVENNESVNIFDDTHKRKSNPYNITKEIPSTTLMKYLLKKKEQESSHHPIDNFFSLMATTVKTFSPIEQHYVKTKVFALVTEIEEKYLMKSSTHVSTPPQTSPTPSLPSTSSSSSSSNHTEMPYTCTIFPEVSIHSPTQCTPSTCPTLLPQVNPQNDKNNEQ